MRAARKPIAVGAVCVVLTAMIFGAPAVAQYFGDGIGGGGGGGGGCDSSLVALLSGGAGAAFGGEIRSDSTHDLVLHSASAKEIALEPSNQVVGLRDINGTDMASVAIGNANYEVAIYGALGTTEGGIRIGQHGTVIGLRGNAGIADYGACLGESLDNGDMGVVKFCASGTGVGKFVPESTLAISGAPDTTRNPLSSGSACRFAAASASQSWTPSETSAVDGDFVCCTNTGSNAVTMTTSAGVYQGSGVVVGQWDTVCMEYVSDRWVERSFKDNT